MIVLGVLLSLPTYHLDHEKTFGNEVPPLNQAILRGVDAVQKTAMDGGGYFIGVKADPPESPIGFPICIFGSPLLSPPRTTSYCSGASYAAFITAFEETMEGRGDELTPEIIEALRMQEPNGGRREDTVKFWGWWNADGPGSLYALTTYTKMGERVRPEEAVAGDFCNINWVKGPGHSVVFLRWEKTANGLPAMRFWSSQKSTNGLGDLVVPLNTISGYVFSRFTNPAAVFEFDPLKPMERAKIVYDVPSVTIYAPKAIFKTPSR
jgi:hypothetical protein